VLSINSVVVQRKERQSSKHSLRSRWKMPVGATLGCGHGVICAGGKHFLCTKIPQSLLSHFKPGEEERPSVNTRQFSGRRQSRPSTINKKTTNQININIKYLKIISGRFRRSTFGKRNCRRESHSLDERISAEGQRRSSFNQRAPININY